MFFDAVGTVLYPRPSAVEVYFEVGRRHGTRRSLGEISDRFEQALAQEDDIDRTHSWRTSEEREQTRWQRIVAFTLDDVTDPAHCFAELYEHFSQPASWQIDPAAQTVLTRLQDSGTVLGLASNYDRRLHRVVAGFPILQRLHHIISSSEIGHRKPAVEFFRHLVQVADARPGEVLYVGDDPIYDFDAAQKAGLAAALVHRATGLGGLTPFD